MALPVAAAIAGGTAIAAYLDAKYHLRYDYKMGGVSTQVDKAMAFLADKMATDKMLVYSIFEDRAQTPEGDNPFLEFEGRKWTYKEFYHAITPVANWLLNDLGIQAGEIVAMDGGNSPEYVLLWLAIEALGAVPAFINCNLTAQPLIHCVKLCDARYILTDVLQRPLVQPCENELATNGIETLYFDPEFFKTLTDTTPLPAARRKNIDPQALSCLIYTSGTTGMPKGTILNRGKEINLTRATAEYLNLGPHSRMYTCLPLYHGAAHGLCFAPMIGAGGHIILGRKFSHKTFWPEVRASKANILQYVGELCRYLVNAPPQADDRDNSVEVAWGNGMRPDVWEVFRQRFDIECVNELYAATDGLGSSFNANRGVFSRNAIGVRGPYWHYLNGASEKRVYIDPDSQEILKSAEGFATECKIGDAGEVLHKMDPNAPVSPFSGYYKNKAAGDKRIIRDVFVKDDMWFRSGDMMRLETTGTLHFVDRLGDTYRWHSENVSTNEVADVLGSFPSIAETNVYGVLVPHSDGRAGCAAIVPTAEIKPDLSNFDFKALAEHALTSMPRYAVPIWVRVVTELEYTGTMKLQKGRLRGEGVDPGVVSGGDRLFWLRPGAREYTPFGEGEWMEVKEGKVRL